jgi:hypothetical protein
MIAAAVPYGSIMSAIAALTVVALSFLSLWWTARRTKRILRKSLGREIRDHEETSLAAWMTLSDQQLDSASAELKHDPFGGVTDTLIRQFPMGEPKEEIIRIRAEGCRVPLKYRLIDTSGGEIGMMDSERPIGMGDTIRLPDGSNGEVLEVYDDEHGQDGGVAGTLVVDQQQ